MESEKIEALVKKQKDFFNTGATLDTKFRIIHLKKLYLIINKFEKEIMQALYLDLGKSDYESYMCEVGLVKEEISYMLKNIKKFAKEKRVHTPLAQFYSKSYKKPCPYGNVLIMSPWNYPFMLTILPLVDALAAGNTAIIKPSAYAPQTSNIIEKIIAECFKQEYVAVVTGGRKENTSLLEQNFDFIFFTGSSIVGKEVLRKAAENIVPVCLELGGKSPCIVDDTAKISLTAKRIVFGKFLNCGQTCVAPDYILCDKKIKEQLVNELVKQIHLQYGKNPLNNEKYGKIINQKHFERLNSLINKNKIIIGGESNLDTLQIAPTILDNVSWEDEIMQEEIFGPILPILTYDKIEEFYSLLANKPKPLALYLFSKNKKNIKNITEKISFGGGCVNDTIIHIATSEMGFGGVGASGMGSYHGEEGFNTFSHFKSIVNKGTKIDLPMRYQPYNKKYEKIVRTFLK